MNINYDALWPFYAGMLIQAVFLLIGQSKPKDYSKLLACCGGSLLGLIPGKHEHDYDVPFHLFLVAVVFSVAYAICFKEKILEHINKEILMVWTLVGLYIALQNPFIMSWPPGIYIILALSAVPVANAFVDFDKNYVWKVYFYVWFLCVLIGIAASRFAFSTVADVFGFHSRTGEINSFTAFIVGMSFLYLAVNVWYVVELIPWPRKHQSFSDRMDKVRQAMKILANDYDAKQVRWWKTVLLLAISVFLLTFNYFKHFVADETLIPLFIVILPVVDKIKLPAKQPMESVADTHAPAKTNGR